MEQLLVVVGNRHGICETWEIVVWYQLANTHASILPGAITIRFVACSMQVDLLVVDAADCVVKLLLGRFQIVCIDIYGQVLAAWISRVPRTWQTRHECSIWVMGFHNTPGRKPDHANSVCWSASEEDSEGDGAGVAGDDSGIFDPQLLVEKPRRLDSCTMRWERKSTPLVP